MSEAQPRTIPNPFWCETCEGRGYVVQDAEWEPYAVQCPGCAHRRAEERRKKKFWAFVNSIGR